MNYTRFKRGAVGGVLALMLLALAVPQLPRAEAATIEELQAQIQALILQLTTLQGGSTSSALVCTPFMSDLTLGRSGTEVSALQRFLMSRGHAIPAGATGYFGGQTQAALSAFQSSNGIAPAVGYFGPITRSKVNILCAVASQPTNPGEGTTTPSPTTPTSPVSGLKGEATLEKFDAKSGDDTNLEEGQKNISVMDVSFKVDDGDVRINRIDLGFRPDDANNEQDPWDTFDEVSVYNGSSRIARIDAGNEDNWDENAPAAGDYRLRMTGINLTLSEGDTAEFSVRVSTRKSIKGANDGEVWSIFVPTNGIRGLDAERSNVYTGDSADMVTIDIDEAGNADELIVKRSDEDPDSTTLQLKSNARSGWMTVFAFDIDTDDSENDIEIRRLPIELTVSTSTGDAFVRDIRLTVDGKTYTKKTITDGLTNTALFEFDRKEFMIDAGDRVTVEVEVEFKALGDSFEGSTIVGGVDVSGIVARGADTLSGSQLTGSANGETHTMRTSGLNVVGKSGSAVLNSNSSDTREDDAGSYSFKFDVTAFDGDIYIARQALRGTTLDTAGVNFIIEDASVGGTEIASGTVSTTFSSDARVENGFYKINEGETKSFTLYVEFDPEYQSFYNVQVHSVNWSKTPSAPTTLQRTLPEQNYETAVLYIGN